MWRSNNVHLPKMTNIDLAPLLSYDSLTRSEASNSSAQPGDSAVNIVPGKLLVERQNRYVEEGQIAISHANGTTKYTPVIVKTLRVPMEGNQSLGNHITNEAFFHRALRHPNLLQCLQISRSADELRIVLEHCKYYDLDTYTGLFTESTATRLIAQLLSVVHYLHTLPYSSHFFVHGDIKANNCFLDKDLNLKLGDFGTVRLIDKASASIVEGGRYGVTRSYLPYFKMDMPIISQCTDVWATFLVTVAILANINPFFQFVNSAALSQYLQHYSSDILSLFDGHDPRYKETFAYLISPVALSAYYSSNIAAHKELQAWFRSLPYSLPVKEYVLSTALFSLKADHETPALIREYMVDDFIEKHSTYKQRSLLFLATMQGDHKGERGTVIGDAKSKVSARIVYFSEETSLACSSRESMLVHEELLAMCPHSSVLQWTLSLAFQYVHSPDCFWNILEEMFTKLAEIASEIQNQPGSALQNIDIMGELTERLTLEEDTSCYFALFKEIEVIEHALSTLGIIKALYLWSLALDYVILYPGPLDDILSKFISNKSAE